VEALLWKEAARSVYTEGIIFFMERGMAHTHVLGLGVDRGMNTIDGYGVFGMQEARKGASIFVDLVLNKKTAGKALLIAGETGTGKTALAVAISRELGSRVPFVKMTGSEVYSAEVKKTEMLHQSLRRAISVRIREIKRVYEGEVISLTTEEREDPLNRYRKCVSKIYIGLKSGKGSQRLTLSPSLSHEIEKQQITVGDVVYVEADDGIIRKIGRSEAYASEFDIENDKYVPTPKGEIFTKKEVVQEMSIHEIDVANALPKGEDTLTLMKQAVKHGKVEISQKLREEVNRKVEKYLSSGSAELFPGVLFIDEAHTLDSECFSFLSTMLESSLCPVVVLATNRRAIKAAGGSGEGVFGMPQQFLSRVLVIKVERQNEQEIEQIVREKIKSKAKTEEMKIEEEAVEYLCEISKKNSIRFAFNILSLAQTYHEDQVTRKRIEEVQILFSSDDS